MNGTIMRILTLLLNKCYRIAKQRYPGDYSSWQMTWCETLFIWRAKSHQKMEYADPELAVGYESFYYRVRWPRERSPLIRWQLHKITDRLRE